MRGSRIVRAHAIRWEKGFTLIELLIVLAVIGIVASMAMPGFKLAMLKTKATRIVGDLKVIEFAINDYVADTNNYPKDSSPGAQPPELNSYLRRGQVNWKNTKWGYQLDWDNWDGQNGNPTNWSTGVRYGIAVTTKDKELVAMLVKVAPRPFQWTLNDNYEYVLETKPKK